MARLEEIEVTIDEKGNIRIRVNGIAGEACLDTTAALEAALGGKILSREMTPEALEQPVQNSAAQQEKIHLRSGGNK